MPSPVGHALGGLLAAGLFGKLDRFGWRDVAFCAAAACLPDIDFLWGRHAMETHSIGAAALAGGVVLAVSRRRDLAVAGLAAWLSHVVFDWLGSDDFPPLGVMALWPLSSEFYFANAFIFEAISRRYREPGFWEQNLWAVAKEVAMLVPPVIVVWWWRRRETRRAMKTGLLVLVVATLAGASPALAQADNPQPSCRNCPGYYIPSAELDAYLKRAMAERIIDQQVRSVDVGKSNVAIGMVHRTKISTPGEVAEHDLVSEVYHVISGSATLVLGPELVGAERRPASNTNVRLLNGPGHNAKSIRNGVSYDIKAGDVVIIPAGTGHWFTKIDDHITYLMVRIDPDKVTPHKDEAASKADLAGKKP